MLSITGWGHGVSLSRRFSATSTRNFPSGFFLHTANAVPTCIGKRISLGRKRLFYNCQLRLEPGFCPVSTASPRPSHCSTKALNTASKYAVYAFFL